MRSNLDPLDKRWTGIDVSQWEPWWATGIRGWLAMVRDIQEAYGETAPHWRTLLERGLELKPPRVVYEIYKDFAAAMELERKK